MKHHRLSNVLYCVCFASLLLVPLLFFNWKGTVSAENRMLATLPAWPKSLSGISDFTSGVESWLKDRMGLRKELITACRLLEVYLLRHSPAENIVLGARGTIFVLRAEHSRVPYEEIHQALGATGEGGSLYSYQLDVLQGNAAAIRNALGRIVFLAVPTAPLFRYDDMPKFLRMIAPRRSPANHPVALALEAFSRAHPEDAEHFLFPFAEAERLAGRYALYPRKNFHWSWSPFTVMVSELLAKRLGQPVTRYFSPADFVECTTRSDLSHVMGVPLVNANDLCPSSAFYDGMELTQLPIARAFPGPAQGRSTQGTYYKNTAVPDGKVLVIGDSFNYSLGLPLARNFREVVVLDYFGVMRETGNSPHAVLRHVRDAYRPEQIVVVRHNVFPSLRDMSGLEVFFE